MTPPLKLGEIEARLRTATPGPWEQCSAHHGACSCGHIWAIPADAIVAIAASASKSSENEGFTDAQAALNGALLAHAPTDLAALLAAVKEAQAALEPFSGDLMFQFAAANHKAGQEAVRQSGYQTRAEELLAQVWDDVKVAKERARAWLAKVQE